MKKILFLILLLPCILQVQLASAQAAELEQLALNIEKLAQLKSILSDMKKGYDLVSKGYGTIKDITEGNFNVHNVFLNGLLAVNPKLARYSKVPGIIESQVRILSEYKSAWSHLSSGGRFTPKELDYLSKVYANLFEESMKGLDELTMVLTASQLRMSDDERLVAIDRIYEDMNGQLTFLRGFNKRAFSLEALRNKAFSENENLKSLYSR